MISNYNVILWDFDGVLIDSMEIRELGFRKLFQDFSIEEVEELIKFHKENGGLSRYVKIKYFYEEILQRPLLD